MKTQNLLSICSGMSALENAEGAGICIDKKFKMLKSHEIRNLTAFCDAMRNANWDISNFDGFFVGYSIGQIGKEFDLLRFGKRLIINIELKSELKVAKKEDKILRQLKVNHYYLKFFGIPVRLFTYVDNDGFYEYDVASDLLIRVSRDTVASCVKAHAVDLSFDPDKEFVPSNYLVSPFNSPNRFLSGEYFLTTAQQRIKDEIFDELNENPFKYFSISANAGTGKTLLLYDLAKDMLTNGKQVVIIHCGMMNDGHICLKTEHNWNIISIRAINNFSVNTIFEQCAYILIDEAQRIREPQLSIIIQKSIEKSIPIVFSYDVKQYLRTGEGRDIEEYLKRVHPTIEFSPKRLTTKIRTNKEMASFITNLLNIGSSKDHLNYDCVTIEYADNFEDLKAYVSFLQENGWTALTYTTSLYSVDPYSTLAEICSRNAHGVIGQEFPKVVFVMDDNFRYSENKLTARNGYYSAKGMLYQIVTRVVDELKIIVFDNPELYLKLLEIKSMGE